MILCFASLLILTVELNWTERASQRNSQEPGLLKKLVGESEAEALVFFSMAKKLYFEAYEMTFKLGKSLNACMRL